MRLFRDVDGKITMTMYLVATESEDGSWFDDPEAFDTEAEAREFSEKRGSCPPGICRALYRCELISELAHGDPV